MDLRHEIKHGKPMPDIFLAAANRFETPPISVDVLVFEDFPNGVKGALSAGMHVVWVPDPREPPGICLEQVSPIDISRVTRLNSLCNFKPEQFGLPAFEIAF
ncbi:putative pseudouridine-5'-phosphatase [Schistosoma japonicum]|uniref:Putative pseudouridine-5'-phosphatase n=1 Tax=Schistosoma japonicum TaxID=6182 RepID=A0A4Z2DM89_SCHJA|nr:putative pseudouridine-5'-phosphatase [Schistosoma japonicum]